MRFPPPPPIVRPINTISVDAYRRFGVGRRYYAWSVTIRTEALNVSLYKQGRYDTPTECADAALAVAQRFQEAMA